MSEVDDTCMTAVLKRTASTDTLAANSKRRDTTEKAEIDLYPDFDPDSDPSVIPYLYDFYGRDILSSKVENHSQLKQKAEELFKSLKNVVDNSGQLATLAVQVKNLFESPAFIQMFVEAYMECPKLLVYIDIYSNEAQDQERLENLKRDAWLGSILQETKTTATISGALSAVLGYWSDKDFYCKLRKVVTDAKRKNAKPIVEGVEKEDRILNLNVSSSIEGLKEALATIYDKEKCECMNEEIDHDKYMYERIFSLGANQRVTWLSIVWRIEPGNESFLVETIGYGDPPLLPSPTPYDSRLRHKNPPVIWVDNLGAVYMSNQAVVQARTKHIEIDLHFIRDQVQSKSILVHHVPAYDQRADGLTKPLSGQFFARIKDLLRVVPSPMLESRGANKLKYIHDSACSREQPTCSSTCATQ